VPATDVHQHLLPETFLSALAARARPPRLRGSTLEVDGDEPWTLNVDAQRLETRLALLDRTGLDRAVVSLQTTLGIELLPAGEREELERAWEEGILEVADASGGRIVPLAAREPADRFAGLCVSALELLDLDALGARLDVLAARGGFLFVHPAAGAGRRGAPGWWAAAVDYTAQMQAAYAWWLAAGSSRWPALDVVFAILAGGAPIQLERMAARGLDERAAMLPRVWFDTASYGRRALELTMATYGVGRMLFGSDVPVVDPASGVDAVRSFGEAVATAVVSTNPEGLLDR
jgi:hypothetical protein